MRIKQLHGHLCFVTVFLPEEKWIMGKSWSIWILMWARLSMRVPHDATREGKKTSQNAGKILCTTFPRDYKPSRINILSPLSAWFGRVDQSPGRPITLFDGYSMDFQRIINLADFGDPPLQLSASFSAFFHLLSGLARVQQWIKTDTRSHHFKFWCESSK